MTRGPTSGVEARPGQLNARPCPSSAPVIGAMTTRHISFTTLAMLAAPAVAVAQDAGDEPVVVVDPIDVTADPPRPDGPGDLVGADARHRRGGEALDQPAFVTVVDTRDHAGETASVAEVLADSMGASVRSVGGLGSFAAVSVRGASSGHTTVLVDGVPVSRLGSVTVDLGRFELASFRRLELYRGGVPVDMGGAALGGALNLTSQVGPAADGVRLRVSAGAGSFATRHLRARWFGGDPDDLAYTLFAGYAGTAGDYSYFNDNGTNLDPGDDRFVDRRNNGYDQVETGGRFRTGGDHWDLRGGLRGAWRGQGVPGSASVQSDSTSLTSWSQLLDVAADLRRLGGSDRLSLHGSGFVSVDRQRYLDLDSEVGFGTQDRRYWTVSGGARGRLSIDADRHVVSLGADLRGDYFADRDLLLDDAADRRTAGTRLGSGITLSDDVSLDGDRLVLQPAVRFDVLLTTPLADAGDPTGPMRPESRVDLAPSPRLSARVGLSPGLVAKGSAGWYYRAPTLLELFGDRGFVVGTPDLRSETGPSADLGLAYAPARRIGLLDRLYLEAAGFARQPRDVIAFVTSAGSVAVARNLGDATVYGGEVTASVRVARTVTASANYTRLESRQRNPLPSYDGKRLPQRPGHQAYARADVARRVAGRLAVAWVDGTLITGSYMDAANLNPLPARKLVGAGLKVEAMPGLLVGIDGKNLIDERVEMVELSPAPRPDLSRVPRAVADFFGYPLPGRAFYLSVEWSHR